MTATSDGKRLASRPFDHVLTLETEIDASRATLIRPHRPTCPGQAIELSEAHVWLWMGRMRWFPENLPGSKHNSQTLPGQRANTEIPRPT